ncbi:MAG TPA: oxidoreductase, partial [Planctomycetaceae bacterium]|nr:oxidoreductase [Planctomycetaceae bacterium]
MDHDLSRRGFLAGASTSAVTSSLLAGSATPAETLRIGLIGCGGIMNSHSRSLSHFASHVHVSWLCDVDPRQIDRIAGIVSRYQKSSPRRTGRFEDIVEDNNVDIVIIGTPHHWHARIALLALAAGKDIYLEKPMSHVFNEGPAIIAAAKKYKRVVQHGSQMRSSPVTEAAGKLLAEGLLGDIRITKAWN